MELPKIQNINIISFNTDYSQDKLTIYKMPL